MKNFGIWTRFRAFWLICILVLSAFAVTGCEECEKSAVAINDLAFANQLLEQGLQQPETWKTSCDSLVKLSEKFRDKADYFRSLANEQYTGYQGVCEPNGWVTMCDGGWGRHPYYYTSHVATSPKPKPAPAKSGHKVTPARPKPGHNVTPAQPRPVPVVSNPRPAPVPVNPRPAPVPTNPRPPAHNPTPAHPPRPVPPAHNPPPAHPPRPVPPVVVRPRPPIPIPVPPAPRRPVYPPHYPPHFPRHHDWYWGYVPPYNCRAVCVRFQGVQYYRPGFEQIQAIAYELDQAAGGIETACTKVYDGAPLEEIAAIATDTQKGVAERALPQTRASYNALGCSTKGN